MDAMKSLANGFLFASLLLSVSDTFAAQPAAGKCYDIGDTISVRGHVEAGVNGGTTFELLEPICVNYPKAPNIRTTYTLATVGPNLPLDVFWEVTGVLQGTLGQQNARFDILPARTLNVDNDVRTLFAEMNSRCKEWQTMNSAELVKQTHGGTVNPLFKKYPTSMQGCGIWSADTQAPRESKAIFWREPKN